MKKLIVFVTLVALCMPFLFIGASAETFDYMDYITNIQILDDGYATVTVDLPVHGNRYDITDPLFADSTQTSFAQSVIYPFSAYESTGYDYDIKISPSWSNKRVNALSLTNLPAKSELNIWLNIESYDAQSGEASTPTIDYDWYSSAGLWYYLKDGNRVKTQKTDFGLWSISPIQSENNYTFEFYNTGILTDPENPTSNVFTSATSFYPTFSFTNVRFANDTVLKLTVVKYQLILHLDKSQLGDKYTKLLNSILSDIKQQGKYLDEITGAIKYVPIPKPPAEADRIQAILDSEDGLNGLLKEYGYDSTLDLLGGVKSFILSSSNSIAAVSAIIGDFIVLPAYSTILSVSASIGVFGIFIGLGVTLTKQVFRKGGGKE